VILRRVAPEADVIVDMDASDAREVIAELYRPPSTDWVRINLVGTVSGGAVGSDGTSESITNPVDRVILNVIRSLADVVLVGAASVRKEGYFVPKRAALAVVTRSGDLGGHRITSSGDRGPLIVLCPAVSMSRARETLGDARATIIPVADKGGILSPEAIVGTLREAGYTSMVAEGGPHLASRLVVGGVVDELCLTTSPLLNNSRVSLFDDFGPGQFPLSLHQLLVDDAGAVYARWTLDQAAR